MKTFKAWESLRFRNGKYSPLEGVGVSGKNWPDSCELLAAKSRGLLAAQTTGVGGVRGLQRTWTDCGFLDTVEWKQANRNCADHGDIAREA